MSREVSFQALGFSSAEIGGETASMESRGGGGTCLRDDTGLGHQRTNLKEIMCFAQSFTAVNSY